MAKQELNILTVREEGYQPKKPGKFRKYLARAGLATVLTVCTGSVAVPSYYIIVNPDNVTSEEIVDRLEKATFPKRYHARKTREIRERVLSQLRELRQAGVFEPRLVEIKDGKLEEISEDK